MNNSLAIQLSIIVPIYKEAENIQPFLRRLEPVLERMAIPYEIIFAVDPSPDNTQALIEESITLNPNIRLLLFSRRFGQPAATMAGIFHSQGEAVVVIDVDLQDPPELIQDLYTKLKQGFEVVYARRRSRQGETLLKRWVAHIGYHLINKLSDVNIPKNTGDFRIMTRRVIKDLQQLNETHGFLRGLVAYIGYKQSYIEYDRDPRFAGQGHYSRFTGSLKIGLNGLISFSSRPLQMMSLIGGIIASFSFLLGLWYLLQKIMGIQLTPGLPTTVLVITFFSGVQLLCLGLMGEYIGRIYDEVKRRPMFIIDKIIDKTNYHSGN